MKHKMSGQKSTAKRALFSANERNFFCGCFDAMFAAAGVVQEDESIGFSGVIACRLRTLEHAIASA